MDIKVIDHTDTIISLEVNADDYHLNYDDVQAATDAFIAENYADTGFTYGGASRVGVGITADGAGSGSLARFFVDYN